MTRDELKKLATEVRANADRFDMLGAYYNWVHEAPQAVLALLAELADKEAREEKLVRDLARDMARQINLSITDQPGDRAWAYELVEREMTEAGIPWFEPKRSSMSTADRDRMDGSLKSCVDVILSAKDCFGRPLVQGAKPARYRYEVMTAYDEGEKRHPQAVISEHFPDAHDFEPAPIGDCWLFAATEREGVPAYFVKLPPRLL